MARYNPLKPDKAVHPPRAKPIAAGTVPDPTPVSHEPVLRENEAKDGLEIRFPTRPGDDVLALFRASKELPAEQRWHWHRRMKCWYARRNDLTRAFAAKVLAHGQAAPVATPQVSPQAALVVPALAGPVIAPQPDLVNAEIQTNVIPVNFVPPVPPVVLAFIPPPRPPLPAWRQRLLSRTT